MSNLLEYKGYYTKVEYSAEDGILCGKIEGIRDLVTFECETVDSVEREFHAAVDDYLAFCEDVGKEPDKTYSGVFNVRVPPELHKKAAMAASKKGIKLNSLVTEAISSYLRTDRVEYNIYYPLPSMQKYRPEGTMASERAVKYGC